MDSVKGTTKVLFAKNGINLGKIHFMVIDILSSCRVQKRKKAVWNTETFMFSFKLLGSGHKQNYSLRVVETKPVHDKVYFWVFTGFANAHNAAKAHFVVKF